MGGRTSTPVGRSGLPNLDDLDREETSTRQTETNVAAPLSRRVDARPTISVVVGVEAGKVVRFTGDTMTIGRSTSCDLVLLDPGVSRNHARIVRDGNNFIVEDLGSKNGTFVDIEAIRRRPIVFGDAIQIGSHAVIRLGLMTEAEEKASLELFDSSMRDALTHAYNRRYLFERLTTELAFAIRHETQLSLVLVDIDHFKSINDRFGHASGDRVLRQTVQRLIGILRAEDVTARIGGEEFAVLLRGIGRAEGARCAERIRQTLASRPMFVEEATITVTASFGVGCVADCREQPTVEALFSAADRRLYNAKDRGRNRVCSSD